MFEALFEGAAPLMARLAEGGPYTTPSEMLARARVVLQGMSEEERIAVINAHPRIGERPEAVRAQSLVSFREQGYERDATSEAVFGELARLNAAYEQRFGFRFVVFVNRRSKAEIVPVFERRLGRPRAEEIETALGEILAIAEDRLRGSTA